jgi:hypothetical protein
MRFISEDNADARPIWMSPQEINNPSEYIRQFCSLHCLADCRFYLWQMLANSVSTKTPHIDASAGEQLYFFENLIPFIEAVFLLQQAESQELSEVNLEDKACQESIGRCEPNVNSATNAPNAPPLAEQNGKSRGRKKHKKLKRHSIWYREKINNPFKIIDEFFDYSSLMSFKANFYEILKVTSEDYFYQKGSPNDVLHNLERFESMINVGYLMNGEDLGLTFANPHPDNKKVFPVSHEMYHSLLSREQIFDPQKVLVSFFEYKSLKEWKNVLIEINDFALSKHPAHEWGVWIDILPVFVHSVKLAEALYLIGRTHKERIK